MPTDPTFPPLPEDLPPPPPVSAAAIAAEWETFRTHTRNSNHRRSLLFAAAVKCLEKPDDPIALRELVKAAKDYRLTVGQVSHAIENYAALKTRDLAART